MTAPDLAVVVLNWNNAPDTLQCLESLRRFEPDARIVVVDNASSDDSLARIRACGHADDVLVAPANLGYTGGNNLGLRHSLSSGARFVAVLNNDTTLSSALFTGLIRELDDRTAVSPAIVYADEPERIWFAGGTLDRGMPRHLQAAELPPDTSATYETQLLTGCCVVAARSVWQRVGLFDDRFFLFFEDSDWSLRARASGVTLRVDRRERLQHGVSRSFRGPASMLGTFYFARNGVLFHRQHAPRQTARFLLGQVLLPPLRGMLGRSQRLPAWPFGLIGAGFGLSGRGGRAPRWLTRWATSAARRQDRHTRDALAPHDA